MPREPFRPHLMMIIAALFALLAGCSQSSSATTPTPIPGPTSTATPALPVGDYAFVRNGDLWAHQGAAPAHQITQLHLSAVAVTWGSLIWSPDHTQLAFALLAPPLAPGFVAANPAQSAGTVFLVNVADGTLRQISGSPNTTPLSGQHIAWYQPAGGAAEMLFTHGGQIEMVQAGTGIATPLVGPQHVWEIVVRGTKLWYSTVTSITASGAGVAQLRVYDLAAQTDALVATLGPVTLPAELCGGVICPPDATTPAVPYPWSVNQDGTQIIYETLAVPAPSVQPTPLPSATIAPSATSTPKPVPGHAVPTLILASGTGVMPRVIFTQPAPAAGTFQAAIAPDGQHAVQIANGTLQIAALPGNMSVPLTLPGGLQVSGVPSWSPDSQSVTLTATATGAGAATPEAIAFLTTGGFGVLEINATNVVWGN
jgi:hypothetical protein